MLSGLMRKKAMVTEDVFEYYRVMIKPLTCRTRVPTQLPPHDLQLKSTGTQSLPSK